MPRTIGLVAILACAAVAAVAGAVTPPLPPPPPPPIAVTIPAQGVAGAAAVPVAPPPPAVSKPVSFSISNAEPADEGKPLTFPMSRSHDDKRDHEIRLYYEPDSSLLVNPPQSISLKPGENALVLQTAPGLPGGGNHTITVFIAPGDANTTIGVRSASGTITDVPLPPRPTYSITLDAAASRGTELRFTVTREGPRDRVRLTYSVTQDARTLKDAETEPAVEFPEGKDSATLVIPGNLYLPCGSEPVVTLSDSAGTQRAAEFSDPPAPDCPGGGGEERKPWYQPFIEIIDDLGPNLALVLGGIAFIGGVIGHFLIPKPPIDPPPPMEQPRDGERLPETQADVEPSLEIKPGAASFQPLEDPVSRWPKFSADVTIAPGDLYVTQPLPRLEPDDG